MVGQAVIDGALRVAGPLLRPARRRLEEAWLEAVSHPSLAEGAQRLADATLPRPVLRALVEAWIRAYDVDMSVAEVPPGGFTTFDAFFTRRLRPGARPIDHDPEVLVSPADSVLKGYGVIDPRGRIPEIKGRSYGLGELVGGVIPVEPFVGGSYGVFYLSPRDYHRVHAPGEGAVATVARLDGRRYPVNDLGVRRVEGLFVKNRRLVFVLDREDGPLVLVMVGATNVGRISASVQTGDHVEKGQELGIFHLGSTVVLLTTRASGFGYRRVHEGEWLKVGQAALNR